MNIRRTTILNFIKSLGSYNSGYDKELLCRITTNNGFRTPYLGNTRGELYIHWWYRDRLQDELTSCEMFHLNMLRYFNVMDKVDVIHIRCSSSKMLESSAMQKAVSILSCGKAIIDFKVTSASSGWEHDTFKEATEYAVSTGKFIYYTHFKGVSRIGDAKLGISPRLVRGSCDLDIYYWCYLMYKALFDAPVNVNAIGPLLHKGINKSYKNRDITWSHLCKGDEVFHYCGSFQAFSGSYITSCLEACGLGSVNDRLHKLWVGDPYTVEMFLSMVSLKDDVYSLDVPYGSTNNIYRVYSRNTIPKYRDEFNALLK